MRDWALYVLVLVPMAVWSALQAAYSAWIQGVETSHIPSRLEMLALWLGNWGVRSMPFAIVAGVALGPVVTLLAVAILRPRPSNAIDLRRRFYCWLAVATGSLFGLILLANSDTALYAGGLPLVWSFACSHALALALACQAQELLKHSGKSRFGSSSMLLASVALQLLVFPAWLVALVTIERAGRIQRA